MTELEFKSLAAQGYNRIPMIAEAFADLETPLTLYLKLAQTQNAGKNTFLLESVMGGERFGRYSFIGLPANTLLRSYGEKVEIVRNGEIIETYHGNPLDFIAEFQSRFKVALRPGMPRFCGGLAGYFGYDAVRHVEKRLARSAPKDDLGLPEIQLLVTEELAVIDNVSGKLYLIVYADPTQAEAWSKARQRLKDLRAMLRRSVDAPVTSASVRTESIRDFAKEDYLKATINYIVSIENNDEDWMFLENENEIDVYKDFTVNTAFYSLVNKYRPEENIAEIYRLENDYADIILLNANKRMARSLKGNIFVINDRTIRTPKKEEGVITSVLRTNFIKKINKAEEFTVEEVDIFPFEIQKAEEVFILIDGVGILPITQNRKKIYTSTKTKSIFNYLID